MIAPVVSSAGQCGYETCWGALGFSSDGGTATSVAQWSQEAAYRNLQENCDWDCGEVRMFSNACAAMARGERGSWSWAEADSVRRAKATAVQLCGDRTINCKVIVAACSR
ncbi:DUF4189 domain-containing protein [Cognatishimia sp. SS12]|uniref:DUF4189 domain-containing protein n=1 Tax=Cognatishimia sp. SS12 TaxID=2979465 RepID=UPI002330BEA8|nr:DUF4189 domain-containing protein [Cognatishimia sp. SS12]MDC0737801.1 DUF4189 domain-containing protein [Cognatishimia sp. SS12]